MPVTLSMNVVQNSVDNTNNRSLVTVTVVANYTGGSFNRNDPPLTVVLDGVSDTVNVDFNASEKTSGSETIYNKQWYVGHNSDGTKTLNYSASYVTGVSSGTVTVSGSKALSPTTGGSSSGGGGSEGGDSEGGGGSEGETPEGGGTEGGGTEGGGSEGGNPGTTPGVIPIKPLPGNSELILISNFSLDSSERFYHSSNSGIVRYESIDDFEISIMKFTTPDFAGVSESLFVNLYDAGGTPPTDSALRYALCTSDANYRMYFRATSVVNDPNQIASGSIHPNEWTGGSLLIQTNQLEPAKEYYLVLWLTSETPSSAYIHFGAARYHGITVNYYFSGGDPDDGDDPVITKVRGVFYIDNESEFVKYECYIDTGTDWSLIGAVSSSAVVQRNSNIFTTDNSGNATIECGFKPDALYITRSDIYNGVLQSACLAFTEAGREELESCLMNDDMVVSCKATRTDTGAQLSMNYYSSGWNPFVNTDNKLGYIAIKYT